jgi:hypothetical protein
MQSALSSSGLLVGSEATPAAIKSTRKVFDVDVRSKCWRAPADSAARAGGAKV